MRADTWHFMIYRNPPPPHTHTHYSEPYLSLGGRVEIMGGPSLTPTCTSLALSSELLSLSLIMTSALSRYSQTALVHWSEVQYIRSLYFCSAISQLGLWARLLGDNCCNVHCTASLDFRLFFWCHDDGRPHCIEHHCSKAGMGLSEFT